MRLPATTLLAALASATCAHATLPEGPVKTEAATFRVTEVAGGLEEPWGLAFLPDGDMLVTEKPGRLRLIEGGRLRQEPVGGVPEVYAQDQGGLLDITLDPDFASNRTLYLSYSHAEASIVRGKTHRCEQEMPFDTRQWERRDNGGQGPSHLTMPIHAAARG
jgi:glucose/arabinose dehydrogenase